MGEKDPHRETEAVAATRTVTITAWAAAAALLALPTSLPSGINMPLLPKQSQCQESRAASGPTVVKSRCGGGPG